MDEKWGDVDEAARVRLAAAAAGCGIVTDGTDPAAVRKQFEAGRSKEFCDQYDARLDDALKSLGA